MIEKEVIIVGGGPAGSSCALRLEQHHVDTLILDQYAFPREKLCAGWITPEVLTDLGIPDIDYPYGLTVFHSFHVSFPKFQKEIRVQQSAVRRSEFDAWLLSQSGAPFEQHRVQTIQQKRDRYIIDGKYACKFIVGAGGTSCPVYQSFFRNISPRSSDSLIIAMEEEFAYDIEDSQCRLWFFENGLPGYAWYVPKENKFLNIGIGGKSAKLKEKGISLKEYWGQFTGKLEKEGLVKNHIFHPKGHRYYLRQKKPVMRNGNALIVGDAVGLATLDMGEGIRPAIKSGGLAAEAIVNNSDYSLSLIPRYSLFSIVCSGFGKQIY